MLIFLWPPLLAIQDLDDNSKLSSKVDGLVGKVLTDNSELLKNYLQDLGK